MNETDFIIECNVCGRDGMTHLWDYDGELDWWICSECIEEYETDMDKVNALIGNAAKCIQECEKASEFWRRMGIESGHPQSCACSQLQTHEEGCEATTKTFVYKGEPNDSRHDEKRPVCFNNGTG